jgi:hypothetical protein
MRNKYHGMQQCSVKWKSRDRYCGKIVWDI